MGDQEKTVYSTKGVVVYEYYTGGATYFRENRKALSLSSVVK